MNSGRFNRRRFIAALLLSSPVLVGAEARLVEPRWVKTRWVRLGNDKPTHRVVHITDIHYRGDHRYLSSVVSKINALSPSFVCFTGDLIEDVARLPEALQILEGIKSPLYGVPGNHDHWSKASFEPIAKSFAATGGRWLMDEQTETPDRKILITGASSLTFKKALLPTRSDMRNLLLMHYPAWVEKLPPSKYDLILAGHSHGGQVRMPLFGAIYVPFGVEKYDLGLFRTESGPLHVNPGLGWFPIPIRFNCRPEITVIEI